ncbi:unnamed protein product [Effrenium voratum]|uniref:Uncharacterized protein n=1 Tax=Effrenium voratum TaxID=2562239 RepID=A0AA36HMX1_9DINO|nr:unnamed protein product [Effrenium voratum]CAJ1449671.1 unnamed protein product [Effrenium voratum]
METVYRDDIKCLDETVQPHLADASLWLALQGETLLAPPGLSKSDSTVTIFDWDDTILCTSLLSTLGFPTEVPGDVKSVMKEIEDQACSLLTEALALGPTYIVTNAVSGWVQDSAAQHLPGLLPLLSRVTVISARSAYAYLYPDEPSLWKTCTFYNLVKGTTLHEFRDVIVVGDSLYEICAGQLLGNLFPDLCVKLVKLQENPSPETISQQLGSLMLCYKLVASNPSSLYWRLDEGSGQELQL